MKKINVGQMIHTMDTLNPNWRGPRYVVAVYSANDGEHYFTAIDSDGVPASYKQIGYDQIKDVSSGAEYFNLMAVDPTTVTNPTHVQAAKDAIRAAITASTPNDVPNPSASTVSGVDTTTSAPTRALGTLDDVVDEILTDLVSNEQLFTAVDVTLKVREFLGYSTVAHWEIRKSIREWADNHLSEWDYTTSTITVGSGNVAVLYHPEDADPDDYNSRTQTTQTTPNTPNTSNTTPFFRTLVHNGPYPLPASGSANYQAATSSFPMPVEKAVTVDRQNDRIRIPKSVVESAGFSIGEMVEIEVLTNGLVIYPLDTDSDAEVMRVTLDGRINITDYWLNKAHLHGSVNVRVSTNAVTQERMIEIR